MFPPFFGRDVFSSCSPPPFDGPCFALFEDTDKAEAGREAGTRGGGISRDEDEIVLVDGCRVKLVLEAGGAILRDMALIGGFSAVDT